MPALIPALLPLLPAGLGALAALATAVFVYVLTVLVKKSDRVLFVSFWFARQSVSGLFLLPASTVGASFG